MRPRERRETGEQAIGDSGIKARVASSQRGRVGRRLAGGESLCPRGGARNLTPAVALCILAGGAWTLGDSLRSQAGRDPKASEPRKLQRQSPDIEPENGTEEVEFGAFDPAARHTDVSGERDVDTRAGRGDPDPPAVVGKS